MLDEITRKLKTNYVIVVITDTDLFSPFVEHFDVKEVVRLGSYIRFDLSNGIIVILPSSHRNIKFKYPTYDWEKGQWLTE